MKIEFKIEMLAFAAIMCNFFDQSLLAIGLFLSYILAFAFKYGRKQQYDVSENKPEVTLPIIKEYEDLITVGLHLAEPIDMKLVGDKLLCADHMKVIISKSCTNLLNIKSLDCVFANYGIAPSETSSVEVTVKHSEFDDRMFDKMLKLSRSGKITNVVLTLSNIRTNESKPVDCYVTHYSTAVYTKEKQLLND